VVGINVTGLNVGPDVGVLVGPFVGAKVGVLVGPFVGAKVASTGGGDGASVGARDTVGALVC
jgi:uncharacterized protein YqgC (DUF456 family)